MRIEQTSLPDVVIIEPRRFGDDRGWFTESWSKPALKDAGIDIEFVQDNRSYSKQVGTVRGLHFQSPPFAQDKLVSVTAGRIYDVAVDVRRGSPNYGEWVGVELSAENGQQLLIPRGFMHGFVTLVPDCQIFYKCSNPYAPECDGAVRFDDADLGIDWGVDASQAQLSDKDRVAQSFADFDTPFTYQDKQQ